MGRQFPKSLQNERKAEKKRPLTELYYSVRNILDEDSERYLIDWEDGPKGDKYEPSWV